MTARGLTRAARRAELPRCVALEEAAEELFAGHGISLGAWSEATRPIETLFEACDDGRVLVREVQGELVGWALLLALDGEAHLEQLDVHPDHGRRGHGRALLEAAARLAAGRGHATLVLTTFASVPWNAPFYRRAGFAVVSGGDLTEGLRRVLAREAEVGLTDRCAMRRKLA